MSEYKRLVDEFFSRYEHPVVEPFILGFSGIDPPRKQSAGTNDHESLSNIMGGNDNEHFHLTKEQLDWIIQQMNETYPPQINPNQIISGTADEKLIDYEINGNNLR